MSFDELNTLKEKVEMGVMPVNKLEDEFEDLLIDLYLLGVEEVNDLIDADITPKSEALREAMFRKFDDKDFRDRLREYSGNIPETLRVLDTDAHRVYQAGKFDTAIESKRKLYKTWVTMKDPKVRDTHDYLEGMKKPIDEDFYTYNGDHAPYPSAFGVPEEDVNCRCDIEITKD